MNATPHQPAQPETAPATAHTPKPDTQKWPNCFSLPYPQHVKAEDPHLRYGGICRMSGINIEEGYWCGILNPLLTRLFKVYGRTVEETENRARKVCAALHENAALISERDRLRDALEIATNVLRDSERVLANIEARKFGNIESGECHELFNSTNTEAGDEAGCIRRKLGDISEALANTTPSESARLTEEKRILTDRLSESIEAQNQEALRQASESARLRERNAELYSVLGEIVNAATMPAWLLRKGLDTLEKAKDAQGGLSA